MYAIDERGSLFYYLVAASYLKNRMTKQMGSLRLFKESTYYQTFNALSHTDCFVTTHSSHEIGSLLRHRSIGLSLCYYSLLYYY